MRTCETRAFTLIEMLLVIAIIVVLAGLLYPVFSKVRESGRSTQCVSNLRQLQVAAMTYAGGGHFPRSRSYSRPERDPYTKAILFYQHEAGWVSWYNYTNGYTQSANISGSYHYVSTNGTATITNGVLWGYIKDARIYACPTFTMKNPAAVRSYSMNIGAGFHYNDEYGDDVGPTVTILGGGGTMIPLFSEDANITASPYDGEMTTNEVWRMHNGKGNVVFVDGHVEKW